MGVEGWLELHSEVNKYRTHEVNTETFYFEQLVHLLLCQSDEMRSQAGGSGCMRSDSYWERVGFKIQTQCDITFVILCIQLDVRTPNYGVSSFERATDGD